MQPQEASLTELSKVLRCPRLRALDERRFAAVDANLNHGYVGGALLCVFMAIVAITQPGCGVDKPTLDAPLPYCPNIGCPINAFCTGTQGTCSCNGQACSEQPPTQDDASITQDTFDAPFGPTGIWVLTDNVERDNCGALAFTTTRTIVVDSAGNIASDGVTAEPGASVTCTASSCRLLAQFIFHDPGVTKTEVNRLTLSSSNTITGDGSLATMVDGGTTCFAMFTATGVKQ